MLKEPETSITPHRSSTPCNDCDYRVRGTLYQQVNRALDSRRRRSVGPPAQTQLSSHDEEIDARPSNHLESVLCDHRLPPVGGVPSEVSIVTTSLYLYLLNSCIGFASSFDVFQVYNPEHEPLRGNKYIPFTSTLAIGVV